MKTSISNIAWDQSQNTDMYMILAKLGFRGLEIAPTKWFHENPYGCINNAKEYAADLFNRYNLEISSIQSIWFGRTESIFGSDNERELLINYTKKAIDFASLINCKNIVFGCPKNRSIGSESDIDIAVQFFTALGRYALDMNTVLSIEANPVIYGTNFINSTLEAFDFVKMIDCQGFRVNVDLGTIIYNEESLECIENNFHLVNHIHISEPNLVKILKRPLHYELADILRRKKYEGFISIEMKAGEDIFSIQETMEYVTEVFR